MDFRGKTRYARIGLLHGVPTQGVPSTLTCLVCRNALAEVGGGCKAICEGCLTRLETSPAFFHVESEDAYKPIEVEATCPFCGDHRVVLRHVYEPERVRDTFAASCCSCAAQGPWKRTRDGALSGWGRRISR